MTAMAGTTRAPRTPNTGSRFTGAEPYRSPRSTDRTSRISVDLSDDTRVLPPADAAKALSHPLRTAVLERLYDREASPVELAKEMGESLPNVSYHVRELHKLGALALVRQRQV